MSLYTRYRERSLRVNYYAFGGYIRDPQSAVYLIIISIRKIALSIKPYTYLLY